MVAKKFQVKPHPPKFFRHFCNSGFSPNLFTAKVFYYMVDAAQNIIQNVHAPYKLIVYYQFLSMQSSYMQNMWHTQ